MADDKEQTPAPEVTPVAPSTSAETKTPQPEATPDQAPAVVEAKESPTAKAEARADADLWDAGQPASEQARAAIPTSPPATVAPAANEQQQAPAQKAHQVEFKWKQEGDEVAPLTEMRAYLHSLKESGVAVGSMQITRRPDGKLEAGFGIDYDPSSQEVGRIDGMLAGAKKIGGGLSVTEPEGQQQARQQAVNAAGHQELADKTSQQTTQTFGRKNWDGLSAALTEVPSKMLSSAEQQQQQAGAQRVEQLAQQQGKDKKEVIKDGKSLLDIEQGSNPFNSFLKNFHAQLTGGAITRTTNEADYEATRQQLRQKLEQRIATNGSSLTATPGAEQQQQGQQAQQRAQQQAPEGSPDLPGAVKAAVQAAGSPTAATSKPANGQPFQQNDLREQLLQGFGINKEQLAQNGQLAKLLNGERTDLMPLKVTGPDGKPVEFEARMQLKRDGNGNAELQLSLPKQKLEIPQEISGVKLSDEQQQNLKNTGQAGLIKGLTDPKSGNKFDGFVGVDTKLNRLVMLPAAAVQQTAEIAGVKLNKEQQNDLEQGKAVKLSNMKDGEQRSFNGTAQINAATARIEIREDKKELAVTQKQPVVKQEAKQEVKQEAPKQTTPKAKRGPRL